MRLSHFLTLALAVAASAAEPRPLLATAGKVITQPTLEQPLGPEWSVGKGKWTPVAGIITEEEVSSEHHSAVLHLATGATPLVMECEFRFQGAKVFYFGCDSAKHVGRLVITPQKAHLAEDSTEVKGKVPSHVLAEARMTLKPDEWQTLRVEFIGDQMAARLNETELRAQHPYLATPKVRWWFAAGGNGAQIRNIRISQAVALPAK